VAPCQNATAARMAAIATSGNAIRMRFTLQSLG
jgi:hypothetical protein